MQAVSEGVIWKDTETSPVQFKNGELDGLLRELVVGNAFPGDLITQREWDSTGGQWDPWALFIGFRPVYLHTYDYKTTATTASTFITIYKNTIFSFYYYCYCYSLILFSTWNNIEKTFSKGFCFDFRDSLVRGWRQGLAYVWRDSRERTGEEEEREMALSPLLLHAVTLLYLSVLGDFCIGKVTTPKVVIFISAILWILLWFHIFMIY